MKCLNISHPELIQLSKDTNIPMYELDYIVSNWMDTTKEDRFPTKEEVFENKTSIPQVNYQFKGIRLAVNNYSKILSWEKQIKDKDILWDKVQKLGIPKEQVELIRNSEGNTVGEKLLDFIFKYSYTVEINVSTNKDAASKGLSEYDTENFTVDSWNYQSSFDEGYNVRYHKQFTDSGEWVKISGDEFDKNREIAKEEKTRETPTQHHSNLTVPGGTNYTENAIRTVGIVNVISAEGGYHDNEFNQSRGDMAGWFRSDDKYNKEQGDLVIYYKENTPKDVKELYDDVNNHKITNKEFADKREDFYVNKGIDINEYQTTAKEEFKTRRILELQSFFQKGRDKENLISESNQKISLKNINDAISNPEKYWTEDMGGGYWLADYESVEQGFDVTGGTKEQFLERLKSKKLELEQSSVSTENQFLQLLNKKNNWVTFFVKSIIQDSAKKGYEKVLFPTGDTASKVEGHETLEEFKKQKEDRIKELEKAKLLEDNKEYKIERVEEGLGKGKYELTIIGKAGSLLFNTREEALIEVKQRKRDIDIEITQLKQELERVETEGFGALKPIFKFYNIDIRNIFVKQYGEWINTGVLKNKYGKEWKEKDLTWQELQDHVKSDTLKFITDEYGNTWIEVTITLEKATQPILLQLTPEEEKPVDEKLDKIIKNLLESLGFSVQEFDRIRTERGLDAVASVDILNKIVKVARGKAKIDTLAEEASHVVFRMLGKDNPMYQRAMSLIDKTDLYSRVKQEYWETYEGNEEKVKEEAVGKMISRYVVNQHLENERNKTIIGQIINTIKMILNRVINMFKSVNEVSLQEVIDNAYGTLAERMLSGKLDELSFENLKDDVFYQLGDYELWKDFPMRTSNIEKLETGEKGITIRPNRFETGYYKFGKNYYLVTNLYDKKVNIEDTTDKADLRKRFIKDEEIKKEHIKDFFEGKNLMYVYQIAKVDAGIQAELEKKEVKKKAKKQPLRKETREDILTGIPNIDVFIMRWDNDVRRLRSKIVPNDKEHNEKIRHQIFAIESRIKKLKEVRKRNLVKETAERQVADIKRKMATYDTLDYKGKVDFFIRASEYLEGWTDISTLLEVEEGEDALSTQINNIQGEVKYLLGKLKILKFNFVKQYMGKGELKESDVLGPLNKTPYWESVLLDISVSSVPAVQRLFSFFDDARANALDKHRVYNEEVKEMYKATQEYIKSSGMSMNDILNLFTQRKENGVYTKNHTDKYKQEYYDELNSKTGKVKSKWKTDNTTRTVDYVAYEKARKEVEREFKDDNGEWFEQTSYLNWVSDYSPDKFGNHRNEFAEFTPIDKWIDPRWKDIKEGKYKGTHVEKLYDFYLQKLKERKAKIPKHPNLPSNYMPEITQSIFEAYTKDGMSGMFRFGGTSLGEKLKESFGAEIESEVDFAVRDLETNQAEKRVPIYMMANLLNPEEKSRDIFKILDIFGAVSYTYEYKTAIEVPVNIMRKLLKEATEKEMIGGVAKKGIYGEVLKIIEGNKNTFEQVDYYIDSMLYDMKKEKPSILFKSKTLSSEDKERGLSLTSTGDTLIAHTQLMGMGLNVFASATNTLFGTLSNFVHAAGNEDYTTAHAMKALSIALTTTAFTSENAKKVSRLMEFFQIEYLNLDTKYGDAWYKKNMTDHAFILMKKTEKFNQMQMMIAKMLNTEVIDKNGKKTSLWDAFEVKDDKLFWDDAKYGENQYGDETEGKQTFRRRLKQIIANQHGAYDTAFPMLAKKHLAGRMLTVFRTWLPRGAYTHIAGEREVEGKMEKGRFISLKDYYKDKGVIKASYGLIWGVVRKMINFGFFKTAAFSNEGLSDIDAANMRKLSAEISFDLAILLMGLMLKGIKVGDDDEEQKALIKFLINQSVRVDSELAFWWSPAAQANIIRNIAPPQRTILQFKELWDTGTDAIMGDVYYTRGSHKGRSKFWRKFWNNIPIVTQIQKVAELPGSTTHSGRTRYY